MFLFKVFSFVAVVSAVSTQCPNGNCKCFDQYEGKHLTTFDKKVEGRTEEECQTSCLTYPDLCLSAQYDRNLKLCYLNTKTHLSHSYLWENHDNFVYFYRREECHRNCYFVYYWKQYLLGYNDARRLSYSSFQCLQWCLVNQEFDCRSVDYDRENGACTISRESKETQPSAWKTHHKLEHFHRICQSDPIVGDACYEMRLENTYLINHAMVMTNKELSDCQIVCFTAGFVCKSIHYDKTTKRCYLNTETHLTKPNWVRSNSNYEYYMRSETCDFDCRFKYNWRRYMDGYNLEGPRNEYTSLECMRDCYDRVNCESYDYSRQNKVCQLKTASRLTHPQAYKYSSTLENFHKECKTQNQEFLCFTTYANRYIDDMYTEHSKDTAEECVRLCLFTGSLCRSASFNRQTKKCYLSHKTRTTFPQLYKESFDFTYFEKKSSCRPDCYTLEFKDYYLTNSILKTLTNKNEVECLKACHEYLPVGSCKSISWNKNTKECYLHDQTRLTRKTYFYNSNNHIYWEIACTGGCFTVYPMKYLAGQSYKSIHSEEVECKSLCLQCQMGCRSAYYDLNQKKCYLSAETRLTKPSYFKTANNMMYWERENVCHSKYYMQVFDNKYLQGYNREEFQVVNDLECMELCLTKLTYVCKSADYNKRTKTCYLSSSSHQELPSFLRNSPSYMYFERRIGQN